MKSLIYYKNALEDRAFSYINRHVGWETDRKIVVIESDDWGSIRMPSLETLNYLQVKGVHMNPDSGYDKYDTLASNGDLEMLFNVLNSVRDKHGNPAKMTFNTVMANPDFNKIKESGYTEYHYELFTETLKDYPNHDRAFSLWQEGIKNKLIKPQFHAREHLNVQLWLKALKKDYPGVRESFSKNVYCNYFDTQIDSRGRFLETYNITKEKEYDFILSSITEGLQLFEDTFRFKSSSMIAPNYIWDDRIELQASNNGVKYMQGGFNQRNTIIERKKTRKHQRFHYMGEINLNDQIYLTRNCLFEPSQHKNLNADYCLKGVEKAFKLNKPAIICSHRLNYIGELDEKNRSNNLKDFSYLLSEIVEKHPNVEFMSSDELGGVINKKNS